MALRGFSFFNHMAFTFHKVAGAENIESLTTTVINSGDAAPFTVAVSTGTGAQFNGVGFPQLITLALAAETETGANSVVETVEVSGCSTDTLTISVRALAGTTARTWPIGSKIGIRLSSEHIEELQDALSDTIPANTVLAGPATGADAAPEFRALVAADIPAISALSGTLPVAKGGTGATTSSSARANLSAAVLGANNDITSLTGLTTPLDETEGGTGIATYILGDIIYGSAANTLAKLSGNTTVTNMYMRQTGDGVNSAAPVWAVISATHIGAGVLSVLYGGTGLTGVASGKMLYASALNTLAPLTVGSTLAITAGTIDQVANSANQQIIVRKNSGANVGTRHRQNFIEGTNIALTVTDSGGNDEVAITIASAISTLDTLAYAAKTTNYVMAVTDTFIVVTTGGSGISITLPLANATAGGKMIVVKKIDSGGGAVTLAGTGGNTIDGAATKALAAQYSTAVLISNGVDKWYVISTI